MKKFLGLATIVALVLGLAFAACDSSSDNKDNKDNPPDGNDVALVGDAAAGDVTDTDCVPVCEEKECGDDGCGGSCGSCGPGIPCVEGVCQCTPACENIECGPDSCGEFCGNGDAETQGCTGEDKCENGMCIEPCIPDCKDKNCGTDGCEGSCGTCPCDDCEPDAIICGEESICVPPEECDCGCIGDCLQTCPQGDQACYANCQNGGTLEAQMQYSAWQQCFDQAGYWDCAEEDDECRSDAFVSCAEIYYTCFHGELTCAEMGSCMAGCPEDSDECYFACQGEGSIEALMIRLAWIGCLGDNGYFDCEEDDNDCYSAATDMCMDEYHACYPPGDLSCLEMYLCQGDCGGDQACAQACLGSGTLPAQDVWDLFIDCLSENGYFDCEDDDADCREEAWLACDEEFKECAHGDFTCSEMFDCYETCAPTDQACQQSCVLNGSVDAQNEWGAMVDCLIEQCGAGTDPECENTAFAGACNAVYTGCIGS